MGGCCVGSLARAAGKGLTAQSRASPLLFRYADRGKGSLNLPHASSLSRDRLPVIQGKKRTVGEFMRREDGERKMACDGGARDGDSVPAGLNRSHQRNQRQVGVRLAGVMKRQSWSSGFCRVLCRHAARAQGNTTDINYTG